MPISFRPRSVARARGLAPLPFLVVLMLGGGVAGCTGDHSGAAPGSAAVAPSHSPAAHDASAGERPTNAEAGAMWEMRPAFVSDAGPRTQAAYAFAVSRPDVLRWVPCYCGCGAMGHGSNLDCFIKPTDGAPVVYEEHGSYCDVCVDIAQTAESMLDRGNTLIQIRAAIDSSFGGLAPGTPTDLPPA
jgi:hypothetical protein